MLTLASDISYLQHSTTKALQKLTDGIWRLRSLSNRGLYIFYTLCKTIQVHRDAGGHNVESEAAASIVKVLRLNQVSPFCRITVVQEW